MIFIWIMTIHDQQNKQITEECGNSNQQYPVNYYGWVFSRFQPCPTDNHRKPFTVGDYSMINQIQQIGVTKHGYTRQMAIIIVKKIIIFRSIYGYPIDKPKYQLVWPFTTLSHFAWSSIMISNKSWYTLNGRPGLPTAAWHIMELCHEPPLFFCIHRG